MGKVINAVLAIFTVQNVGLFVLLMGAVFFAVLTCKSKKSDLFKWIGIALFIGVCFTWILPTGQFASAQFTEQGLTRIGFGDIPTIMYYAVYFGLTYILYLLVVGGFYGILGKTKSYEALVQRFSKWVSNDPCVSSIIIMVSLIVLTSITKSTLNMIIFLPFLVSVLLNAKFDKITTAGLTFGSVLVGNLAATYGTDGLYWFNQYLSKEIGVGLSYRLIIAVIALLLFVGYNILRIRKMNKKTSYAEEDLFAISKEKSKAAIWPTITILSFLLVFVILAFVNWNTAFHIDIFDKFHKSVTELSLFEVDGAPFTIFKYILGTNAVAFGQMEVSVLIPLLLVLSIVIALMNKINLADFMDNFGEGFKKMFKPVCLYALAYALFIIAYMSPFTAYISDVIYSLSSKFNPFVTTISAFISSIFHADLGYTGYQVGALLTTNFAEDMDLVHTIYINTYGLVQLFMPTSAILLVGLSYLKVDYKAWFKYIWMFALAMLVVLLIFVTFVTYVL